MSVARFDERVIINSSSSRTEALPPSRRYSVESESSALSTSNGEPSTSDGNVACTTSESSSVRSPASASRKIWIITGTFIVLAAWNRRFAPMSTESGRARLR